MTILRRLIFGEVFHTGDLDDRTRELLQCFPYVGFPRAVTAIRIVDDVA